MKRITLKEYVANFEATLNESEKESIRIQDLESAIKTGKTKIADASDDDVEDVIEEIADKLIRILKGIIKVAVKNKIYLDEKYIRACKYFFGKVEKKGQDKEDFLADVKEIEDYFKACTDSEYREDWELKRQNEASEKTSAGRKVKDDPDAGKEDKPEDHMESKPSADKEDAPDSDIEKEIKKELEKESKGSKDKGPSGKNIKSKKKLVGIAYNITEEEDILDGVLGVVELTETQIFAMEYVDDVEKAIESKKKIKKGNLAKAIKDIALDSLTAHGAIMDISKIYIFDVKAKEKDEDPWLILNGKKL